MSSINKIILLLLGFAGVAYWLIFGFSNEYSPNSRKGDFFQASLQAEPLIEAIKKYSAAKKNAPNQLADLLPLYIKEIPDTGLEGCDRFKYVNYGTSRVVILWYDLGSRHGQPVAKESRFPDGDPSHAILTFTVGEGDYVIDAKFDRMPKENQTTEFDSEQWRAGNDRIQMAPDLPDKYAISRMPRSVLEQVLGPPNGVRILRDVPWELRINCPRNLTERDILIYWPSESYPQQLYGGNTETIGSWLYVH